MIRFQLTNVRIFMILHRLLASSACANCESPIDVDEEQTPIDVDEEQTPLDVDGGQSSMDVDMKGKSTIDADTKGKFSSEPHTQVPIGMSVENLEKFYREASRSFFDEIGLISHQINSYNDFISHGLEELFDSLGEVIVEPGYDPSKKGSGDCEACHHQVWKSEV
jgi:DNA-directed RNA polymerase IV and V subunit 2